MIVPLPSHWIFRVCVTLLGALALFAPWGLRWLHVDNGIEQWVADGGDGGPYQRFLRDFGSDACTVLTYEGGALFEPASLDLQWRVLEALEALPDTISVRSIPSVFRDQFGGEDPEALAAEFADTPFYDNVIVSPDRQAGAMIIQSRSSMTAAERHAYFVSLREAAGPLTENGWALHLVGPGVLNASLDRASEAESRRLLPVAIVLSVVILLGLLRSVRKVTVVVLAGALALVLTLGLMGWLGLEMNMVTVALPPVLWVLSLAYTLHFLRYFDTALRETGSAGRAIELGIARCAWPGILAALTTTLGFAALTTAGMEPVRELGIAAAIGIPVAFVSTFGIGPLLIRLLRVSPAAAVSRGVQPTSDAGFVHERHPTAILIVTGLLTVLAGYLTMLVRTESNPLTFLEPDSLMVRDSEAVAARGFGLYTLETVLDLPGSWLDEAYWPAIAAQADALAAQSGITRVVSPLDHLKKLQQWDAGGDPAAYRLPEDGAAARRLLDALPAEHRAILDAFVAPSGDRVRLSALVTEMDGGALVDMVRWSEGALASAAPEVTGHHTGIVLLLVRAQLALIDSQLRSLAVAIPLIFSCVAFGLRSYRLLLLALVPNLLPILGLFGIMGAAGIPLDPATVVVAAMALGIAVDDTLHLLLTWRENDRAGTPRPLRAALRVNRAAMVATSLTACAGFLALGLSGFTPIQYYGLLSAAAMAMALAADLWLLPALILVMYPGKEHEA